MEDKLLSAAFFDRTVFDKINEYNIRKDLSDQGQVLWDAFSEYYKNDNQASSIDKEILLSALDRKVPKHLDMFKSIVSSFEEVSVPNLLQEIIAQKKERVSLELTQALAQKKDDKVFDAWKEYELLSSGEVENDNNNQIIISPKLEEVFAGRSAEHRIPIYPQVLSDQLDGGALRKHHIVIFAPTDMGKTFFILNMIRGFIENQYKVLFVCNEDPVSDLIERFLICITGKDKYTIRKHYDKAQKFAERLGWENLIWAELTPGTLLEIDGLIGEHKPDVLVVDQIRNLNVGEKDNVKAFEAAAKAMRNFAKRYDLLAVSATQAADSASGRAILQRGDIDNSNVGIPGTADLMLGIGATEEQEFEGIRTLSFPKQKISGNKRPLQVFFNYNTMRVDE